MRYWVHVGTPYYYLQYAQQRTGTPYLHSLILIVD